VTCELRPPLVAEQDRPSGNPDIQQHHAVAAGVYRAQQLLVFGGGVQAHGPLNPRLRDAVNFPHRHFRKVAKHIALLGVKFPRLKVMHRPAFSGFSALGRHVCGKTWCQDLRERVQEITAQF
jgi:hypothetical protein